MYMKKIIEVSFEIEKYDENLLFLMKQFGTITLIDKLKHKRPIFAQDDPYYFDRYTYTYEYKVNSGCEELADNLIQLATNNDLLN